ncbi:MAG: S9 family peptidase [Calditrichia bacterium]
MSKFLSFILIFFISLPLMAEKKAFSIEDLYHIKGVSGPQVSPDGKQVVFSVTEYNLAEGTQNSDLYLMNSDGGNVRRLTRNSSTDHRPRWSEDGRKIYFMSGRNKGEQLWEMPLNGGEPRQLTYFPDGISNPEISTGGEKVVFSSRVYPECGADTSCNLKISKAMDEGPLQAHMADSLLYRHWTSWKDGTRRHIFVQPLHTENGSGGNIIDLSPGNYESPSFSLAGATGYDISPDGKELCFVSNRDSNEAETTNKDLWLVSLSGGQVKNITDNNEAYDGNPLYSPDGRYIAFLKQVVPTYEADRFRLALYDRKSGGFRVLTEDFDYWVSDFQWAPDSRSIFFTAEVKGQVPLYKVDINGGKVQPVLDAKTIGSFDISADGKWIYFSRRAIAEPTEIYRATASGKDLQRLTVFNKEIEDSVDIRPAEELWISSPTGKKIHTFLIKPHDFDPGKKYPLIVNVHGGPQSQWADAFRGDWQVYPGAGYVLAFPNPHGSTGYGQEFTEAISKDWGGKVYQDVMAVTDSLSKLPYVDAERMGAMGWSYGGYMMMWLEGHTKRFKALVSMMGVYNLASMYGTTEELWFPDWDLGGAPWENPDMYKKWSPHNYVKNFSTPCLVITGEKDYRVNFTESLQFFTALQKMGVPSRLIVFKNDGHWPSYIKSMPFYYNAHLDWFHKYLGGDPAPYDMTKMWRNMAFEK